MNSQFGFLFHPSVHDNVKKYIPGRADSLWHEDHLDGYYPRDTELYLTVFCCNFPKEQEGIKNIKKKILDSISLKIILKIYHVFVKQYRQRNRPHCAAQEVHHTRKHQPRYAKMPIGQCLEAKQKRIIKISVLIHTRVNWISFLLQAMCQGLY